MTSLFLFGLLFLFLVMGVPIAFSLGLSSILTILFFTNDSLASMSLKLFDTMAVSYTHLLLLPAGRPAPRAGHQQCGTLRWRAILRRA